MDPIKITETDRQANIKRWRTHLELDPNVSPSFSDLDHVNRFIDSMLSGKRPELAPPGYSPSWPMSSDSSGRVLGAKNDESADGLPTFYLSNVSISDDMGKPRQNVYSSTRSASVDEELSLDALALDQPAELEAFAVPLVDLDKFSDDTRRMRERHEQELQTKEGRARWDKFESGEPGRPPPGYYKRMKELHTKRRQDEKLDWPLLQKSIKEYKQRVTDGREKPPTELSGKAKGKKGRR